MIEYCDHVELRCPGCRGAIVDIRFESNDDGGTLTIDHAQPPCLWWSTKEAKRWAISIVTDAITREEPSS